jgi:hypothetical protein
MQFGTTAAWSDTNRRVVAEKLALAVLLSLIALTPRLALGAERHPSVAVEIGACLDVEPAEVRRIVAIELRALMKGATGAEPITQVAVDCYNPLVEIRVEDPITGKSLVRRIDLSMSERNVRARLLALAIAELVSSSWTELVSNPEPTVAPAGPTASEGERGAATQAIRAREETRHRPIAFGAAAVSHWFLRGAGPLVGGRAEVMPRIAGGTLTFDATVDHGVAKASLGDVSMTTVTGGAGWRARWSDSNWLLEAGGEARLGAAWLSGTPRSPDQTAGRAGVGWIGGPVFVVRGGFLPYERTMVTLGAELGYAAVGANGRVASLPEVKLDGAWFGVTLGVSIAR